MSPRTSVSLFFLVLGQVLWLTVQHMLAEAPVFQTYVRAGSAAVRVNELLALLQTHHVGMGQRHGSAVGNKTGRIFMQLNALDELLSRSLVGTGQLSRPWQQLSNQSQAGPGVTLV